MSHFVANLQQNDVFVTKIHNFTWLGRLALAYSLNLLGNLCEY